MILELKKIVPTTPKNITQEKVVQRQTALSTHKNLQVTATEPIKVIDDCDDEEPLPRKKIKIEPDVTTELGSRIRRRRYFSAT